MNTFDELLAAYDRALTAYTDCPEHQDAHTLAASRFYAIDYDAVTGEQRALIKCATLVSRGSAPAPFTEELMPADNITGRLYRRWPELQRLPPATDDEHDEPQENAGKWP